jgi:electron transfer flavoprotein beta subunit
MRIVVPIKQILDPTGVTVRADKERIFVNTEAYIIRPADKVALEAALQLKDGQPDFEVVALSLGPQRADDALREAMAMGADQAYLLLDPLFEELDPTGIARVLAAAMNRIHPDLIIASWDDDDMDAKQVGPRLAEVQDLAQITDVCRLLLHGDHVLATRRWEKGYAAVQAPLPALVTVAPDAYLPRYLHAARIINAYQDWSVVVWNSEDLEIQPADLTPILHFRGQSFAPVAPTGELLRGDPKDVAHELAGVLKYELF